MLNCLPKRWVVERSFAWLEKCRRLWKNCERKLNTSRRCYGKRLLELARLDGGDHPVYRCRWCGFLFSPPERDVMSTHDADVERSSPPRDAEAVGRRLPAGSLPRRRPASPF